MLVLHELIVNEMMSDCTHASMMNAVNMMSAVLRELRALCVCELCWNEFTTVITKYAMMLYCVYIYIYIYICYVV